jgi:Asp/Glu/hydantoin racemase
MIKLTKPQRRIESMEDVHLAHKLVTEYVEKSDYDAYVIACFCDPGVEETSGTRVSKMYLE